MLRTQIQLTEAQQHGLRQLSAATGRSISDLIREGIDRVLASATRPSRDEVIQRANQVAGQFSSGTADGSAQHDRYLAEAFKGRKLSKP